ncbi:hypothetical protein QUA13_07070 [Microcoleus sp. S28C3]|uniref:hypothetical protein n=1 Tax=Microcoleus sp. S28C3 TaxID=3055414 RepID=UPI002FD13B53
MRCGRSSSRNSPTGDRSLCATYHILEGAYNPESENRPKSTIFKIAVASSNSCRTVATSTSRPLQPIRRSTSIGLLKYFSNSIDIN